MMNRENDDAIELWSRNKRAVFGFETIFEDRKRVGRSAHLCKLMTWPSRPPFLFGQCMDNDQAFERFEHLSICPVFTVIACVVHAWHVCPTVHSMLLFPNRVIEVWMLSCWWLCYPQQVAHVMMSPCSSWWLRFRSCITYVEYWLSSS